MKRSSRRARRTLTSIVNRYFCEPLERRTLLNAHPDIGITPAAEGSATSVTFSISPVLGDNGPWQVDWGDSSLPEAFTIDDNHLSRTLAHSYADSGNYTMTFTPEHDSDFDVERYSASIPNVAPFATISSSFADATNILTADLTEPYDPSPADTDAGFRFSVSTNYDALARNYADATDSPSIQLASDEVGQHDGWIRIFDKDNGYRDYNPVLVVPDLGVAAVSSSQINLTWQDVMPSSTGYRIERSDDGGQTFYIYQNLVRGVDFTSGSTISWSDVGLDADTRTWYRVRAFDDTGSGNDSGYSPKKAATTLPINAPSGLNGTVFSDSEIDLTWADNSSEETGFQIDWSANGSDFAPLDTTGAGVTSFEATGLTAGTEYNFSVTAIADNGVSDPSNTYTGTTLPLAPSGLSATDNDDLTVAIKWNPVAGAEYYELQRSKAGSGSWTTLTTTSDTSYQDDGGDHQSYYDYKVRAYNESGYSDFSELVEHVVAPVTPANVSVSLAPFVYSETYTDYMDSQQHTIDLHSYIPTLTWNASPNAKDYEIQVEDATGYHPYSYPTSTTLTITGAPRNFRIRSRNATVSPWVYFSTVGANLIFKAGATDNGSDAYNDITLWESDSTPYPNIYSDPSDSDYNSDTSWITAQFDGTVVLNWSQRLPHTGGFFIERSIGTWDAGIGHYSWSPWQQIANPPSGNGSIVDNPGIDSTTVAMEARYRIRPADSPDWVYGSTVYPGWAGRPQVAPGTDPLSYETAPSGDLVLHLGQVGNGLTFAYSRDGISWHVITLDPTAYGGDVSVPLAPTPGEPIRFYVYNYGNYHSAIYTIQVPPLNAPTDLRVVQGDFGVNFDWKYQPNGAYGYEIEASADGVHYFTYATGYIDASTEYNFTNTSPGTTYPYFRIRAVGGDPTYSSWTTATAVTVSTGLTAHRTGGNFGQAVSRDVQDGGNPADFVVLTNNDYEEWSDGSARDYDDTTALITDDQVQSDSSGNVVDDDLVQLTLGQLPDGLSDGTFKLSASDPSAVRFFDDQGQELTNLTLDLSNPSGYLAGVLSGDLDVWMEGLHKSSDLTIKAAYTDPAGDELARDTVHMLLAEWNIIGKSGSPITTVAKDSQQLLLDQLTADPNAPIAGDDVFFKNQIDGLPSSDVTSLTVTSDSVSSDSYTDDFGSDVSMTQSSDWAALFAPEDGTADLTSAQLAALKDEYQLNVVHNPAGDEKLQTKDGNNFPRKVAAKQQDDGQKIYDLLTADANYGEMTKFVLDRMDWNNDGTDYHKRLVFQSMKSANFAVGNGVVYVNTGGSDAETKQWALDGLRVWAAEGVSGLAGKGKMKNSGNTYFARIARQWARHFYWQVTTTLPPLNETLTPGVHPAYFGTVDPTASPDAAVFSLSKTFAFLYFFSGASSAATTGAMYSASGTSGASLATVYLWVFSNRFDIFTGSASYEVNIPTKFGINFDYFEMDTTGGGHVTAKAVNGPYAGSWPDEDQLHHFAGYFYLGVYSKDNPIYRIFGNDNPLIRALTATNDYPWANNPGDYDLGVVAHDLGFSFEGNRTDINGEIWQELSITTAQANQINGRTMLP